MAVMQVVRVTVLAMGEITLVQATVAITLVLVEAMMLQLSLMVVMVTGACLLEPTLRSLPLDGRFHARRLLSFEVSCGCPRQKQRLEGEFSGIFILCMHTFGRINFSYLRFIIAHVVAWRGYKMVLRIQHMRMLSRFQLASIRILTSIKCIR